jgi:uncharacterized LabA/DUF88 family protein
MSRVVYVFIDASNLWQAQKAKGRFFDYSKLLGVLKKQFKATKLVVYYYTAYPAEGTRQYSLDGKHKFYTFLSKSLGFIVRKKELKRIVVTTEDGVSIEEKGNMDVEMTIDAVHYIRDYDIAVLFTGDSDFLALVRYIRARNKKVYVFSSRNNISSELRKGADEYFDVLNIGQDVWR